MQTRICSTCRIEKLLDQFHSDKSKHGGKDYRCIPCNKIRHKIYRDAHKPQTAARDRARKKIRLLTTIAYKKRRRQEDPSFKLEYYVSNSIRRSLNGLKAGRSWEDLVGYTVYDLYNHITKLLGPGMTWKNYGSWHIDHIIPKSKFGDDIKSMWAINNLQPLWAEDNIKKGNK